MGKPGSFKPPWVKRNRDSLCSSKSGQAFSGDDESVFACVEAELARACARGNEPGKRFIGPFQQHRLLQRMTGTRLVFQFLEEYLAVGRQALSGILLQEGAQVFEV